MNICKLICTHIYIYIHIYIHKSTNIFVCVCVYIYIYIYIHTRTYMCVCVYLISELTQLICAAKYFTSVAMVIDIMLKTFRTLLK